MNRGSTVDPVIAYPSTLRFNEAPIHESGKFRSRLLLHPGPYASMRPRFMNRGSAQS